MNDFDRLLEIRLRQMLDPVVVTRPPTRRDPSKRDRKPLFVVVAPLETTVFGGAVAIPVAVERPAVL
jgi:hypothetical protein